MVALLFSWLIYNALINASLIITTLPSLESPRGQLPFMRVRGGALSGLSAYNAEPGQSLLWDLPPSIVFDDSENVWRFRRVAHRLGDREPPTFC